MNRVIERFARTYTYQRRNPTTLVKGRVAADDLQAPVSFRATIQPLSGRELLLLPEGQRVREYVKIYTDAALKMTDQPSKTKGDLVTYNGCQWEVTQANTWDPDNYAHSKFLAVIVEADKP